MKRIRPAKILGLLFIPTLIFNAMAQGDCTPAAPQVMLPVCNTPPRMDGTLADAEWANAAVIANFYIVGPTNTATTTNIHSARLMRDDQWLYIGFQVAHPRQYIHPQATKRDARIQAENCVKVSFDPGTDGKMFYHIRLSADNVVADQRSKVDAQKELISTSDWNIPLRSATQTGETGWEAELALPWSMLLTEGDPARARLNLMIYTFTPLHDPAGALIGERRDILSWAPVGETWWTDPQKFGQVAGLSGLKFKTPFLPLIEKCAVNPYHYENGQWIFDVVTQMQLKSDRAGKVRLIVTDMPLAGPTNQASFDLICFPGPHVHMATNPVPVKFVGNRVVRAEMRDALSNELLQTVYPSGMEKLRIFSAWPDRSCYTTEKEAWIQCRLAGMPGTMLKKLELAACRGTNDVVGRAKPAAETTPLCIKLKNFENGIHPIMIECRDAAGSVIARERIELVKRAPKPGFEYKADRVNRILLQDGKPIFPIGVYLDSVTASNEPVFKEMAEIGFNTVIQWTSGVTPETAGLFMKTAARYNLMGGLFLELIGKTKSGITLNSIKGALVYNPAYKNSAWEDKGQLYGEAVRECMPAILAVVTQAKETAGLMFYYLADEPYNSIYFPQYIHMRKLYRKVLETDGYHPMLINYQGTGEVLSPIPAGNEHIDWCDVFCTDNYWSPPENPKAKMNNIAEGIWETASRGAEIHAPIWITLTGEWTSRTHKRMLLPQEQRCQTWLALIYGAKGLLYFCYPFMHQQTVDSLHGLIKDIKRIMPMLVAPDVPQTTAYNPAGFDPARHILPDVHVSLRSDQDGHYILLCANPRDYPVEATINMDILSKQGVVSNYFDNAPVKFKDHAIREYLEPFAVRTYGFAGPRTIEHPVIIRVDTRSHPEQALAEQLIPRSGRSGKKNIQPNPGFEEAVLPGLPDYYRTRAALPRIGEPNAGSGLETNRPFEGRYCMRLSKQKSEHNYIYWHLAPQTEQAQTFTFSVYMRADRDNMTVRLDTYRGFKWVHDFSVTRDWRRYQFSGIIPPHVSQYSTFGLYLKSEGTVWVDAVQVEAGDHAAEYEP